jgi:hypothetical protein
MLRAARRLWPSFVRRTPKGTEVRTVIKHVTKRLRKHCPNTRIVWRGDGHYGRSWDRVRKVVARLECSLQPDGEEGTATGRWREVYRNRLVPTEET